MSFAIRDLITVSVTLFLEKLKYCLISGSYLYIYQAHNLKAVGSNPTPATIKKAVTSTGGRPFNFVVWVGE